MGIVKGKKGKKVSSAKTILYEDNINKRLSQACTQHTIQHLILKQIALLCA